MISSKVYFLDTIGIYQCGPASRNAIKEGDVDLDYDCPFVFAEVNADCMYWNYDPATRKKTLLFNKSTVIGQLISTKAVGRNDRIDVTSDYKYEEGKKLHSSIFGSFQNLYKLYDRSLLVGNFGQLYGKRKIYTKFIQF